MVYFCRPSSGAKLLTPHAFHEIGSRSTTIINLVQRFFAYHMIDSYGCDYSTSGLTLEYVNNKLRAFFDRHTSDGPRFDTYIVYYSGDVYEKGDWALAGEVKILSGSSFTLYFNLILSGAVQG